MHFLSTEPKIGLCRVLCKHSVKGDLPRLVQGETEGQRCGGTCLVTHLTGTCYFCLSGICSLFQSHPSGFTSPWARPGSHSPTPHSPVPRAAWLPPQAQKTGPQGSWLWEVWSHSSSHVPHSGWTEEREKSPGWIWGNNLSLSFANDKWQFLSCLSCSTVLYSCQDFMKI